MVYFLLVELGDIILGMDLLVGGYLIYGLFVNFSGKIYNFVSYGVDFLIEVIDYDVVWILVREYCLKLIVVGVSVYLWMIDFKCFCEIVDEVDVKLMVDMVYIVGLVVLGLYLNLVLYVDIVISMIYKILCGFCGGLILINSEELVKKVNSSIFLGI